MNGCRQTFVSRTRKRRRGAAGVAQATIVVINESARTSLPTAAFSGEDAEGDALEVIRYMPLAMFSCGFVKYEIDGMEGVWMRTHMARNSYNCATSRPTPPGTVCLEQHAGRKGVRA